MFTIGPGGPLGPTTWKNVRTKKIVSQSFAFASFKNDCLTCFTTCLCVCFCTWGHSSFTVNKPQTPYDENSVDERLFFNKHHLALTSNLAGFFHLMCTWSKEDLIGFIIHLECSFTPPPSHCQKRYIWSFGHISRRNCYVKSEEVFEFEIM